MALPSGLPPMAAHDATQAAATPAEAAPKSAFRVDTKGAHITFFCGERIYTITPTKNLNKQQLENICKAFQKAFDEDQNTVTKHIQLAAGQTEGKFGDKYKDRSGRTYEYIFSDKGIEFRRLTPDPNNPGQLQIKTKTIQKVDEAGRGAIPLDVQRQRQGAHGGGGINPAYAPVPAPRGPLPEVNAQPEHGGGAGGNVAGPGAAHGGSSVLSQEEIIRNTKQYLDNAERSLDVLSRTDSLAERQTLEHWLAEARKGIREIRDDAKGYQALSEQFERLRNQGEKFKPLAFPE